METPKCPRCGSSSLTYTKIKSGGYKQKPLECWHLKRSCLNCHLSAFIKKEDNLEVSKNALWEDSKARIKHLKIVKVLPGQISFV